MSRHPHVDELRRPLQPKANITDTLNLVYVGHFDEDYRPKV